LQFESLEPRVVLTGIIGGAGEVTASVDLALFVTGQQQVLPANIGVQGDGSKADTYTLEVQGDVFFTPDSNITLQTFFDTWRTNAGQAGNNASSNFSQQELLGNAADANNLVKMFVNGQVVLDYEQYVLQDGDQISIVYTDNPVVSLNTNFGSILIELVEDETPGTVDNFLNYVNDGDYVNSFIHRSVPGFVIQGGGFLTTDITFTSTDQFSPVPTDPAIPNEPFYSNLRGTIAMAKTSQPISATSQFFFNLGDNSFLNASQFTVFGQVLSMTVVDLIASFPVDTTNFAPFGELPLGPANELTVVQSVAGHGELVGEKYLDSNGNGARDNGEQGIPGAVIYIDANTNGVRDAGELSTTTDAQGVFRLAVAPGTYTVRTETPAGMIQTQPISNYVSNVVIGRDTIGMVFGQSVGTDFGDAPDTYGTTLASDGPRHLANGPTLGALRDVEADAATPLDGSGDDTTGVNDNDGIVNAPSLFPGEQVILDILVSGTTKLDAWLDINGNGVFEHPAEHINGGISIDVIAGPSGTNLISFTLPADAVLGETYARVRVSEGGGLTPTGAADNGEVEDYAVEIGESAPFWQNQLDRHDVRGVGRADLLGLIAILNFLLDDGPQILPRPTSQFGPAPYLDVNGDGAVRVNDLVDLLQHLHLRTQGGAEPFLDGVNQRVSNVVLPEDVDSVFAVDNNLWIDFSQYDSDPWKRT
jgi:cyclophilin family peptidyl-prolyl cis-trans isomerase